MCGASLYAAGEALSVHVAWHTHVGREERGDAACGQLAASCEGGLELREGAALPKRVAPIDELVGASLEAAVHTHLPCILMRSARRDRLSVG